MSLIFEGPHVFIPPSVDNLKAENEALREQVKDLEQIMGYAKQVVEYFGIFTSKEDFEEIIRLLNDAILIHEKSMWEKRYHKEKK